MDVLDHFRLGVAHFDANRLDAAMQEFNAVLALEPQHFWCHYRLALCHIRLAEESLDPAAAAPLWEAAGTHLSVCLKESNRFGWGLVLRGHVRSQMGQREHDLALAHPAEKQQPYLDRAAAHWKSATEDLAQAQRLNDDAIQYSLLVERGLLRFRQGSLGDAAAALEKAQKLWPEGTAAYTILALVYEKQRKRSDAIRLLDAALQRSPKQAGLYRSRAFLHKSDWNWKEALRDMDETLRLEPTENTWQVAADHVERARLLLRVQQPREAVEAYTEAVRVRPGFARAYRERSDLLELLGKANPDLNGRARDYEAALSSLNLLAALGEGLDDEFYRTRARVQRELVPLLNLELNRALAVGPPQAERAEELRTRLQALLQSIVADHGRALDLKPGDAATHAQRGWDLLLLLEAPKLALPDFKQAIDLRMKTKALRASDYVGRGLCKAALGLRSPAVDDAEAALQLGQASEKGKELTFLLYNVSRIFAQAAGRISQETAGRPPNEELRKVRLRYEDRALKHLKEALAGLDEKERGPFWQGTVADDAALAAIRQLPEYKKLNEIHGGRPHGGQ